MGTFLSFLMELKSKVLGTGKDIVRGSRVGSRVGIPPIWDAKSCHPLYWKVQLPDTVCGLG